MTPTEVEIKELYERHNLSPDEIARDTGFDVLAVKNVLMQVSRMFRTEGTAMEVGGELITEEEDRELIEAAKGLAFNGDNEVVRAKMIMYLHDEKKGRNDKDTKGGINVSILQLNGALKQVRKALAEDNMIEV